MKIKVDMVYICHYKKLTDRKKHITEQLEKFGLINHYFVEQEFDKDTWNMEDILKKYPNINKNDGILQDQISNSVKSLALKHAWIVDDMYNKKYSSILVLEDDAVLCDDFVNRFNSYVDQLPSDWDIGWVGSCCNLKEPEKPNVNVYRTNRGSRCTHAFCLSARFASKMAREMRKISGPADFYYNHIIKRFNLNSYWFQPPLALQSLDFTSSLKVNPNFKWNAKDMG